MNSYFKVMYCSDPVKVTKGKSALEKALKLAKKLKKETTMVKDFLESVNQDLDSKETTPGVHNLDQDLSYVKVLREKIAIFIWLLKVLS